MEKTCKTCQKSLPISSFHTEKKVVDGRTSNCRDCISAKRQAKRKRERDKTNDIILVKKMAGCVCCGYKEYPIALDLHHTDPSVKLDKLGAMKRAGVNKVLAEVDKCVVICAICHRLLHAGIIQLPS